MDTNKEKRRFHYDENGTIEVKPFYDVANEDVKEPYVELTYEEWCRKLSIVSAGYVKHYDKETNEISEIVDKNSNEAELGKLRNELSKAKQYLSDTDYIVAKLQEEQITDQEEYEVDLKKYSDQLAKRKEYRRKASELIDEIEKLSNQ